MAVPLFQRFLDYFPKDGNTCQAQNMNVGIQWLPLKGEIVQGER
jgi:hypothetical protein